MSDSGNSKIRDYERRLSHLMTAVTHVNLAFEGMGIRPDYLEQLEAHADRMAMELAAVVRIESEIKQYLAE